MTSKKSSASIATVLCCLPLLANSTYAQATIPNTPPSLAPEAPAAELWQRGEPTVKYGTSLYRDVTCRVTDKVVSFEWRFATPQTPGADNVKDYNSEVFATRFWPTFVLPVDPYRLCVAGKARTGETVLELWKFDSQSSNGTPAPAVTPLYPQGGGAPQYTWTLPPRTSVEVILNTPDTAPQGLIRGLFPDLSSANRVFAYYDSSREIYSVDLVTKTQTLVASPSGAASSMQVAGLTDGYQRFWAADYTAKGYCYLFAPVYSLTGGTLPDLLVLIDSDRNGSLDSSLVLTGSDWATGGWGDAANLAQPAY